MRSIRQANRYILLRLISWDNSVHGNITTVDQREREKGHHYVKNNWASLASTTVWQNNFAYKQTHTVWSISLVLTVDDRFFMKLTDDEHDWIKFCKARLAANCSLLFFACSLLSSNSCSDSEISESHSRIDGDAGWLYSCGKGIDGNLSICVTNSSDNSDSSSSSIDDILTYKIK